MAPGVSTSGHPSKPRLPHPPTPSTLTPRLRNELNASLLHSGHIERIHSHLLTTLHSTTFPSEIRHLCLSLLRNGDATSYPELLAAVRARITPAGRSETAATTGTTNGVGGRFSKTDKDKEKDDGEEALKVPKSVVEEAIVIVRECLGEVCDVE